MFIIEEVAVATSLGLFVPKEKFNDDCLADSIPTVSIVIGCAMPLLRTSYSD
jgi:hypothetical protein